MPLSLSLGALSFVVAMIMARPVLLLLKRMDIGTKVSLDAPASQIGRAHV